MGGPADSRRQAFEDNKLAKRLRRLVGEAITDYDMIREGDRVMVCLSGGKDSYTLLDILLGLRDHAPVRFEIIAVNLDQRHPGYPEEVLPAYLDGLGIPYRIVVQDTYSTVKRLIKPGVSSPPGALVLVERPRSDALLRTATSPQKGRALCV